MPSKNPPISLRLKPGVLELVDKCAAHHKLSRHAAIVALIEGHISLREDVTEVTGHAVTTPPRQVLAQAEAKAAHLATPKKRSWSLKGVQFGPSDVPPGSRLKGGGLHPKRK